MTTGGADSWIAVKGNAWTVTGNAGRHTPRDGIQVQVVCSGWGRDNTVLGNTGAPAPGGRLVLDRGLRTRTG